MFANLNGSIGLAFAGVFAAPFLALWPLLPIGIVLLVLIYLARHHKQLVRLAALAAALLSAVAFIYVLPVDMLSLNVTEVLDAARVEASHATGQLRLAFAGLAALSVVNACLTLLWGQSRHTAKSFDKLGW